jgi:hypothetical protein
MLGRVAPPARAPPTAIAASEVTSGLSSVLDVIEHEVKCLSSSGGRLSAEAPPLRPGGSAERLSRIRGVISMSATRGLVRLALDVVRDHGSVFIEVDRRLVRHGGPQADEAIERDVIWRLGVGFGLAHEAHPPLGALEGIGGFPDRDPPPGRRRPRAHARDGVVMVAAGPPPRAKRECGACSQALRGLVRPCAAC